MIFRVVVLLSTLTALFPLEVQAASPWLDQAWNAFQKRGGGSAPRLPYGTIPLNSSQIPQILSTRTDWNKDTRSIETIRNKLAVSAFAIDGKQFSALDHVFTSSAVANYSEPLGVLSGLDNITSALEQSLNGVGTQHLIGNQFTLFVDERNAFSVTYFQVTYVGGSDDRNDTVFAVGQYQDSWFRKDSKTQDWLIVYRNVV